MLRVRRSAKKNTLTNNIRSFVFLPRIWLLIVDLILLFVTYYLSFTIMSKQAFEEANEVFVDDKYEEAYEVRD